MNSRPHHATSRPPIRFCTHCDHPCGPYAVKLAEIHTATGPGRTLYTCPSCTPHDPQLLTPPEER